MAPKRAKPAPAGKPVPKPSPKASPASQPSVPSQPSQPSQPSDAASTPDTESQPEQAEDPDNDIPDLGDMSAKDWIDQQAEVNEFIESDRQWVPFVALTPDQNMAAGQGRERNGDHVAHLRQSMVLNPQRPPLEGLLVVRNAGMLLKFARNPYMCAPLHLRVLHTPLLTSDGETFTPLGGQHICAVYCETRIAMLKENPALESIWPQNDLTHK
jgi:hypothetical protein